MTQLEQLIINRLIEEENDRGAYVKNIILSLGADINLRGIERILVTAVVNACRTNTSTLKREARELDDSSTDEEIATAMEMYTCAIDNHLWCMFFDDVIARERINAARENPSIIGFDGFSFKGFHHIGFEYGLYWYAITGIEPDVGICSRLSHFHADLITETLKELEKERKHPKKSRCEDDMQSFREYISTVSRSTPPPQKPAAPFVADAGRGNSIWPILAAVFGGIVLALIVAVVIIACE